MEVEYTTTSWLTLRMSGARDPLPQFTTYGGNMTSPFTFYLMLNYEKLIFTYRFSLAENLHY